MQITISFIAVYGDHFVRTADFIRILKSFTGANGVSVVFSNLPGFRFASSDYTSRFDGFFNNFFTLSDVRSHPVSVNRHLIASRGQKNGNYNAILFLLFFPRLRVISRVKRVNEFLKSILFTKFRNLWTSIVTCTMFPSP